MSLPWAYLQDRNVILCTDDRCHDVDDGDVPPKKPTLNIPFSFQFRVIFVVNLQWVIEAKRNHPAQCASNDPPVVFHFSAKFPKNLQRCLHCDRRRRRCVASQKESSAPLFSRTLWRNMPRTSTYFGSAGSPHDDDK